MEQIILNILEALRRGETVDDKALVKLIHAEARREGADKRDLAKRRLLPFYQRVKREEPVRWAAWNVDSDLERQLLQVLRMKPRRTASGVATITVITKPWPCSGDCLFCPNDLRMPKSYLHAEPACARAEQNCFDPYLQVTARLHALVEMGHVTDKVELIVLGGTWSDYPQDYQAWFVHELFRALNDGDGDEARRAAGKMPANGIWFWAEGTAAALPNFPEHYGSDGGVVSAVPLCHGIGILTGLEAVTVPTATGEWDTDYEAKTAAALKVLEDHDFAAVHLEGPDEATHNHDLEHKIYSVECLSERVAKPLCAALRERGEDFRLLLLSDHPTLLTTRTHDGSPVPYAIYDSRTVAAARAAGKPAPMRKFCEEELASEPVLMDGTDLMKLLFDPDFRG